MAGKVKKDDVVVIRYEGPRGGPGMREMLTPTSLLSGMGLDSTVALITDGRFSGGLQGQLSAMSFPRLPTGAPLRLYRAGILFPSIFRPERSTLS